MSSDCCSHECRQGDDCPVRKAQHTAARLNTDGSSAGRAKSERPDDTGRLIWQGMALTAFLVSMAFCLLL